MQHDVHALCRLDRDIAIGCFDDFEVFRCPVGCAGAHQTGHGPAFRSKCFRGRVAEPPGGAKDQYAFFHAVMSYMGGAQCVIQVGQEVVIVLEPDRKPQEIGRAGRVWSLD
jgi:hypothetical protein